MTTEKKTAAEIVAEQIIDMIHDPSGVPSWRKPWTPPPGPRQPVNASTEKNYRGANAMVMAFGRFCGQPTVFATFNQWKDLGEKEGLNLFVKKGEKSTPILVPILKKDEEHLDANGDPKQRLVGTKLAFGFHVSQITDGEAFFERKYGAIPAPRWDMDTIWPVLKERIGQIAPLTMTASDRAFYRHGSHEIFLPQPGQFASEAGFYGTVLHELTHATEQQDEAFQNSIKTNKLIGKDEYAYCELRAELGSLLLAQTMGLPTEVTEAASYIEGWGLKHFAEAHKAMILQAANYAQNAVDIVCTPEFMLALQERRNAAISGTLAAPHPQGCTPAGGDLSITPADLDAGKRYTFTSDPGHGWLVVPTSDIAQLGIAQDISICSYLSPRGGKAYLEEDCDAPRFVTAYAEHYGIDEDALWKKIAITNNIDRQATCRSYDHFDPERIPGPSVPAHQETFALGSHP
ncbi:MAG: zincin-like metallopeptidase domain-containing protein [Gammaproteobacteria bacterium]|nr:zincin-like metallopeptidase domain-containing protein [Gammaproteobacteria bacterium]